MKPSTLSRSILVLVLSGVTACSSPVTDYERPVTTFATATKDAETALSTLNAGVTNAYATLLREQAVSGEALVEVVPGDCLAASSQCRLDLLTSDGTTQSLPPRPPLNNMVALMGSIATYANNLKSVVSANTAEQVAANVNATIGSVESIAATVEQAGGAKSPVDLSSYATPAGDAVAWIAGQYIARVKVDGLRRATSEAQPVIAEAAKVFETAANEAAQVPRATMSNAVNEQLAAFQTSRTQANLAALIQSASQYDAFLEAKPADVFARMSSAHEALTRELQGGDVSLAEAIARIESFAAEARRLAGLAKAFAASQTGS